MAILGKSLYLPLSRGSELGAMGIWAAFLVICRLVLIYFPGSWQVGRVNLQRVVLLQRASPLAIAECLQMSVLSSSALGGA